MKIHLVCLTCAMEDVKEKAASVHPNVRVVDVQDDGVYLFECERGHQSVAVHQALKFEVLFESGCWALLDGYFRESVASITAAVERFYEFFFRVYCRSRSVEPEQIEAAWKPTENRSEAQAGMFYASYLILTGRAFSVPNPKFRNTVIHKGYFPTRSEALKFAEENYGIITESLDTLHALVPEALARERTERIAKAHASTGGSVGRRVSQSTITVINFAGRGSPRPSLEDRLNSLALNRAHLQSVERHDDAS